MDEFGRERKSRRGGFGRFLRYTGDKQADWTRLMNALALNPEHYQTFSRAWEAEHQATRPVALDDLNAVVRRDGESGFRPIPRIYAQSHWKEFPLHPRVLEGKGTSSARLSAWGELTQKQAMAHERIDHRVITRRDGDGTEHGAYTCLHVEIDVPEDVQRALAIIDEGQLPKPLAVWRPANGHVHLYWPLKLPVLFGPFAKRSPQRYFHMVNRRLGIHLRADPNHRNTVGYNAAWPGFRILTRPDDAVMLEEVSKALDRVQDPSVGRPESYAEGAGVFGTEDDPGANCRNRQIFWKAKGLIRGDSSLMHDEDRLLRLVLAFDARGYAGTLSNHDEPKGRDHCRGVVRSVARWHRNHSPDAARRNGRKGGLASWARREKETAERIRRETYRAHKLRSLGHGTCREVGREMQISKSKAAELLGSPVPFPRSSWLTPLRGQPKVGWTSDPRERREPAKAGRRTGIIDVRIDESETGRPRAARAGPP